MRILSVLYFTVLIHYEDFVETVASAKSTRESKRKSGGFIDDALKKMIVWKIKSPNWIYSHQSSIKTVVCMICLVKKSEVLITKILAIAYDKNLLAGL